MQIQAMKHWVAQEKGVGGVESGAFFICIFIEAATDYIYVHGDMPIWIWIWQFVLTSRVNAARQDDILIP